MKHFARGDPEVTTREYKITPRLSRGRDGITGKRREFVDVLQATPVGTTRIVWSRRAEAGESGIYPAGWSRSSRWKPIDVSRDARVDLIAFARATFPTARRRDATSWMHTLLDASRDASSNLPSFFRPTGWLFEGAARLIPTTHAVTRPTKWSSLSTCQSERRTAII